MRQVYAILADSLREAIDRKILLFMLLLACVPILLCFSVSFTPEPMSSILTQQAKTIGRLPRGKQIVRIRKTRDGKKRMTRRRLPLEHDVVESADINRDSGFSPALIGGTSITLNIEKPEEIDKLTERWFDWMPATEASDEPSKKLRFLEARFSNFGYEYVEARFDSTNPNQIVIGVRSEYPLEIRGGHEVSVLFGLWTFSLGETSFSISEVVLGIQQVLAQGLLGGIGMLIALFATAGFIPNMLQKGTLDLLLARPISRTKLLLTKYLGGLWFVFAISTFTITGCWLGLAIGSGYNSPWFLASILSVTASFAVTYSVSAVMGVWTRSWAVASLTAIGVWFVSSQIVSARHAIKSQVFFSDTPGWLANTVEVVYAILPKVGDFETITARILANSQMRESTRDEVWSSMAEQVDWAYSLGTTAAFTAVMLALAAWLFNKKEY